LAVWLREQGYDAAHATELGLTRAPDVEVLARAKQQGRTVITVDLDYPRLLALAQTTAPSLILFRDGVWSEADIVARMREILHALDAAEIAQSIVVVERGRVRRRKLPIARTE
jgi:predicted nuclease of predicted toxin-antitoxin system